MKKGEAIYASPNMRNVKMNVKRVLIRLLFFILSLFLSLVFFDLSIGMSLIIYAMFELVSIFLDGNDKERWPKTSKDGWILILSLIGFCFILIGKSIQINALILLGAIIFAPCFSGLLIRDFQFYLIGKESENIV